MPEALSITPTPLGENDDSAADAPAVTAVPAAPAVPGAPVVLGAVAPGPGVEGAPCERAVGVEVSMFRYYVSESEIGEGDVAETARAVDPGTTTQHDQRGPRAADDIREAPDRAEADPP